MESLASAAGLSIKHVRQKLQALPTTLAGTYDAAIQRIENQEQDHKDIAFKTLAWLSYAFRSLSLRELQHALAIEPGDTELDDELLMDGQSITALCAGLVIVDQGTNVVNLVHYTTKKYFEEIRHIHFPNFHASITLSCATYLTLGSLKDATIWELVQQFPLAGYAAQYMGDHARLSPEESLEPSILEVICQLLSHPDKRRPLLSLLDGLALIRSGFYSSGKPASQIKAEAETYDAESEMRTLFGTGLELSENAPPLPDKEGADQSEEASSRARSLSTSTITGESMDSITQSGYDGSEAEQWEAKLSATRIPEVTALHLAASMGLARVASMLLRQTPNIDAVDETGKTALAVAMERGFEKAVEFLLHSGACVDLRNDHGRAVFLLVTERNWHNAGTIIAQKARAGLDEKASTVANNQLRLLLTTYDSNIDGMRRLTDGVDVDLQSRDRAIGEMALFLAIERDNLEMVQALLTAGVNPNAKDNAGQTSLHRAARRGNEAMIILLLENRAGIDCKDDDGRTPWSANLRSHNKRILSVLLEAGADPSTRGHQGVSELYTAGKNGETECVKFMLESGTDPSIKTNYDWTPLHWAASFGHIDCVRLLLDAGADVSALSDQNTTPLDLALQANQTTIVEMLKRLGAKEGKEVGEWKGGWVDVCRSLQQEETDTVIVDKKVTLVFDKPLSRTLQHEMAVGQFIYPFNSKAPEGQIYQISHVMETPTASISIRRAKSRATMFEYPLKLEHFRWEDVIYDIVRVTIDSQEFELRPKGTGLLPGTIRMHREWTGGWKVHHCHEDTKTYLFRTTPDWSKVKDEECRWMTEEGKLLARTGWEDATPNMRFEHGVEREMQDVLVSCWTAKLWSETVARQPMENIESGMSVG